MFVSFTAIFLVLCVVNRDNLSDAHVTHWRETVFSTAKDCGKQPYVHTEAVMSVHVYEQKITFSPISKLNFCTATLI